MTRGAAPSGRSTSCRALASELVWQNANDTYDIEADIAALNTSIRVLHNTSAVICCINFRFTNYNVIMTTHVFSMHFAGGDSRG